MNTIKTIRATVRDHDPSQFKFDRQSIALLLDEIENLEQSKNHFMNCGEKTSQKLVHCEQINQRLRNQIDSHICTKFPGLYANPYTGAISEPEHLVITIESLMHLLKLSQSDHGTDKGKLRQIQSILDKAE